MPSRDRLRWLWWSALLISAVSFVAGLTWVNSAQGPGLDWIWGIAAFGAAAAIYNLAFFLLRSIFAPALASFVKDDTEVQGDDVTHVVHYGESGDDTLDPYIRAYASARGVSAAAIVSVIMITIALTFF